MTDDTRDVLEMFLEMMEGAVEESERDAREIGFRICEENGSIYSTKHCVGEECSVSIEPCHSDDETIASFHTHPWSYEKRFHPSIIAFLTEKGYPKKAAEFNLIPSADDTLVALIDKRRVSCIGNEGGIICYPLKEVDEMTERGKTIAKTIDTIVSDRDSPEVSRWLTELDRLTTMIGFFDKEWVFKDEIWLREP